MEWDNDVKSTAVTARREMKSERRRKSDSVRQDDGTTAECVVGRREAPSLKSVMDELLERGISQYITDYSGCQFYRPFGDEDLSSDGSVCHESLFGNNSHDMSDFLGYACRKPSKGTKMKVAYEGD